MYKLSSKMFTQYFVTARLSLRERQIFVTGHSVHRYSQTLVTVHSVLRHSQKLQTSKHGQAHTMQLYARTRDLTMAAAGHAYGMAGQGCARYN